MQQQPSDEELVSRIVNGEHLLFEELVERYRSKVASLIYSIINSREELDDVAQEVFVSVYRSLRSFENRSTFSTWIYRITVNKCRDWQRKVYLRRPTELLGLLGQYRASPTNGRLNIEDREAVREAVRGLPEKYRTIVILYYYHDRSCQEIADILEMSKKTVETRLMRGRNLIETKLDVGGDAICSETTN